MNNNNMQSKKGNNAQSQKPKRVTAKEVADAELEALSKIYHISGPSANRLPHPRGHEYAAIVVECNIHILHETSSTKFCYIPSCASTRSKMDEFVKIIRAKRVNGTTKVTHINFLYLIK